MSALDSIYNPAGRGSLILDMLPRFRNNTSRAILVSLSSSIDGSEDGMNARPGVSINLKVFFLCVTVTACGRDVVEGADAFFIDTRGLYTVKVG